MKLLVARLPVDPAKAAAFEAAFAEQAARVAKAEPGCLLYHLAKNRKVAGKYTVLELYADTDALKTHGANMKANPGAVGFFLSGAPELTVLDAVGPPGLKGAGAAASRAVVAKLTVAPEHAEAWEAATQQQMAAVQRNETETLLYCLGKSRKTPGTYHIVELYRHSMAIKAHASKAYFADYQRKTAGWLAGAPSMEILATVDGFPDTAKPTHRAKL
jgi:quinol monooxygenase YgiN